MGRGKSLSSEEQTQVSVLKKQGLPHRQIARLVGRSRSVVDHFVNLGSAYSTQWAGGTNKKLSETQKRILLRKARSGDG